MSNIQRNAQDNIKMYTVTTEHRERGMETKFFQSERDARYHISMCMAQKNPYSLIRLNKVTLNSKTVTIGLLIRMLNYVSERPFGISESDDIQSVVPLENYTEEELAPTNR